MFRQKFRNYTRHISCLYFQPIPGPDSQYSLLPQRQSFKLRGRRGTAAGGFVSTLDDIQSRTARIIRDEIRFPQEN